MVPHGKTGRGIATARRERRPTNDRKGVHMRYCTACVQPDSRPNIYFNEAGLCGACLWEEEKKHIDWQARKAELSAICQWAKAQNAAYDCVIGVSGGKDSTFQALYMRDEMKMRPLLVCSEPYHNTELGFKNIENIKNLGFDVISLKANNQLLLRLFKKDFFAIGNPNRASEYCLHSSVFIIADKFDIPLIVNGENPGQTLGVADMKGAGGDATQIWATNTVRQTVLDAYAGDADANELFLYRPDMGSVLRKGIRGVWLSNYVKDWGQLHNAKFALAHGLSIHPEGMDPYARGQYRRFYALDHGFREVNQLLKYIKFGFGFATDQACYDLRDGEISRDEAVFLVKELDGGCGQEHLRAFCRMLGISQGEFWEAANSFRGKMWRLEKGGWVLENPIWEQEPVRGTHSVRAIMERLGI